MKKVSCVIAVSALFILLFCRVSGKVKRASSDELDRILLGICSAEEFYADEENIRDAIFYSNAEIFEKYCAVRIMTDAASARGYCAISFEEAFCKANNTNDEDHRLSNVARLYRTMYPSSHNVFPDKKVSLNTDVQKEFLCYPQAARRTLSSDGETWTYSANYVVSYYKGEVQLIIRSSDGMKDQSAKNNTEILGTGFKTFTRKTGDGLFKVYCIGKDRSASFVVSSGLSSPLLYDLSDYKK